MFLAHHDDGSKIAEVVAMLPKMLRHGVGRDGAVQAHLAVEIAWQLPELGETGDHRSVIVVAGAVRHLVDHVRPAGLTGASSNGRTLSSRPTIACCGRNLANDSASTALDIVESLARTVLTKRSRSRR